MDINVQVCYHPREIKSIAVQCPKCEKWFNGWDIVSDVHHIWEAERELRYEEDIRNTVFKCPFCKEKFGDKYYGGKIKVVDFYVPKILRKVEYAQTKTKWE